MSLSITIIVHSSLSKSDRGSTGVPSIGGQVLWRSISGDNRPMPVRTLVIYWPISDRYASMYDWCMTDVIDIGRTTWDVSIEPLPWHNDHVSGRQAVQNDPKAHYKYIVYLIGEQCDLGLGLFGRWRPLGKKLLTTAITYRYPRFPTRAGECDRGLSIGKLIRCSPVNEKEYVDHAMKYWRGWRVSHHNFTL